MKVIGRNPTIELLRSTHQVIELYLEEDINEDSKISEIIKLTREQNIPITQTPRRTLDNMADKSPHQGVIATMTFEAPNFSKTVIEENPGTYIYIRETQYEHNLGAIIRTAEVAGIAGVIIPPKQDITPTSIRISMGAIFHIPILKGSLFPTIKLFRKNGMLVNGIERNDSASLYDGNLADDSLLIIGGEDKPLSQEVQAKCDQILSIPQFGKVNSLNMSVAAGIVIFEHVRQKIASSSL